MTYPDERSARQLPAELDGHPLVVQARAKGLDPVLVLSRMHHTSFVSQRHRYIYVSTPKAACTKLKHLIALVEGGKLDIVSRPYLRETRIPMLVHQRRYLNLPTVLDLGADGVGDLLSGKSDFFIFALVRNPFSRLVSTYENKVRMHEPNFRRAGQLWGAAEAGNDVRAAFAGFVREGVPQFKDGIGDHHFVTQHKLLAPDLIPYSRIFHVENFGEFQESFFALLRDKGFTGPLAFKDLNRSHHPDWRHYYDEQTAQHVAEMYKADFDAFGYDLNSWRAPGEVPELRTPPEEVDWRRAIIERNAMIDYLYNQLQARS